MARKHAPGPRRAGISDEKETADALEQLNWLRVNRPRTYDQLMIQLAKIVAIARAYDD